MAERKRDPRDFALWKGHKKETEPATAAWPAPWGPGPARLAHRVLGDGRQVPRAGLRHPRRRRRPALPAPRERAGPGTRGWAAVRVVLDAQRLDHHLRREDEQVARQLADHPQRAQRLPRHRAPLLPGGRALPLTRGVQLRGARRGGSGVPQDRELPGAVRPARRARRAAPGVRRRHERRPRHARSGRGPLRHGPRRQPQRRHRRRRRRPSWQCSTCSASTRQTPRGRPRAAATRSSRPRSTCSSPGCSSSATGPAEDKDFAAADAIRDQLKAAGIEVEDTPDGPKWTVS